MKLVYVIIFSLIVQLASAQDYNTLITRAADALNQKNYCKAFDIFKVALTDSATATPYDYYSAAISAANCNSEQQALLWLNMGERKGLGLAQGDIAFIEKDSSLAPLHKYKEWASFIAKMKKSFSDHESVKQKKADEWMDTIVSNSIRPRTKNKFNKPNSGFALYYTKVDSLDIPYLVYVPTTYKISEQTKAVVFLHGGVVNLTDFQHTAPEIASEPIFSIAENFNAIVVYPFGKRDFGWVNQEKAFENIYTVLDSVQKMYNLDSKRIYLGGMSNGGTATFWFASQKNDVFDGFFAISAMPRLDIADIDFSNLSRGQPFYSINAKDDDVFPYDSVLTIYNKNKSVATDWKFETIDTGGHGFIYDPDKGISALKTFLNEMLTK